MPACRPHLSTSISRQPNVAINVLRPVWRLLDRGHGNYHFHRLIYLIHGHKYVFQMAYDVLRWGSFLDARESQNEGQWC